MKKALIILIVCSTSVFAQQRTMITDSVLLGVLDSFIDELRLEEKKYKIVKVRLLSFELELKVKSVDTVSVGAIKGLRVDSKYETIYSLALEYETNSKTIGFDPVTYYTIHRKIPILMSTGFEYLIQAKQHNKRKLMRVIKKSSSPYALAPPIIWSVHLSNKKATIRKFSSP